MFFGKKKSEIECPSCSSKSSIKFSFCPYCGASLRSEQDEEEQFGLLGRTDNSKSMPSAQNPLANLGITDRMLNTIMSSMMKNLSKMKGLDMNMEGAEITNLPNGISIKIGPSKRENAKPKKSPHFIPTEEQIKKLSSLPRAKAKSSVKRFSDKVVYELAAPGIASINDVFVSKLETGYEIKAIGEKKVYVNSVPIELPLKSFTLDKEKLSLEFLTKSN
jgi:hypothetical protein